MSTIAQALKNASTNGSIPTEVALRIAAKFDQEREETKDVLKKCERETGMVLGESINAHLSRMAGVKFSPVDYHYEKPNGEQ